jgi:hypothetical protein
MPRLVERLLIVVAALAISIAVIALLSGGLLAGRDSPGVSGAAAGPGVVYRDQGDAVLKLGELEPEYDSVPPTSGPHVPTPVTAGGAMLTNDQLLTALAAGNVVFMYGSAAPPPGLSTLAAAVAAPFTPALAASGEAVILAYRPQITGVVALAWTRMLQTATGSDPSLRAFALAWLGRGAP